MREASTNRAQRKKRGLHSASRSLCPSKPSQSPSRSPTTYNKASGDGLHLVLLALVFAHLLSCLLCPVVTFFPFSLHSFLPNSHKRLFEPSCPPPPFFPSSSLKPGHPTTPSLPPPNPHPCLALAVFGDLTPTLTEPQVWQQLLPDLVPAYLDQYRCFQFPLPHNYNFYIFSPLSPTPPIFNSHSSSSPKSRNAKQHKPYQHCLRLHVCLLTGQSVSLLCNIVTNHYSISCEYSPLCHVPPLLPWGRRWPR